MRRRTGFCLVIVIALPVFWLLAGGPETAESADARVPAGQSNTSGADARPLPSDSTEGSLLAVAFPGEALFDHELHTDDLELDCADCHHETDAAPLRTPHEEYFDDYWIRCQTCHYSGEGNGLEPQACSECHPETPASVIEETLSAKVVIHISCAECHDWGTALDATEACAFCHAEAQRRWDSRDEAASEEGS